MERYIPGRRKYRLIASSVTTSAASTLSAGQENLSIWGNWQNQGNNVAANTGTFITGGSAADGFDPQTQNASLFTYNDLNRSFSAFTSANGKNTKYTPLTAGKAYYMFVYGDRKNGISTSTPNSTVLHATGALLTGDQAYNTTSATPLSDVTGRYTLIGNPFASPIDWSTLPKTNLSNTYWGWDPNLSSTGGYISVSTTGTVTLISPFSGTTGLNQYIQPGQGFFVRTTGSSPALTIRETDKTGNFNANAFRTSGVNNIPLIAINLLYDASDHKVLADGTLAAFDQSFSNQVGKEDAFKINNNGENIAIVHGTELMSIDARQSPRDTDTLFLHVTKLTKPQYTLQIFTRNMSGSNLQPYLEDIYLHSLQLLSVSDTNRIVFNINTADAASYSSDRFRIVFKKIAVAPTFIALHATSLRKNVLVNWTVARNSGILKYDIETSAGNIYFTKAATVKSQANVNDESYQWLDVNPLTGTNYYRIRCVLEDGTIFYSKSVSVNMDVVYPGISIFPNPVRNQQINLYANRIEKGKYTLEILNARGRSVESRTIEHTGLSQHVLIMRQVLPQGIYFLQLTNGKVRYSETVYIE